MGAHARWPRAQRAALPGSRRVVFLKAAPSSQPSPEVKRPMRSRDVVSGAPVARAGRVRAALCPGRRCVSASSPGRASRRGRRWRASSSASRPQFPAGTRPRRPTHVLPPTSSGFPAFRTPAGRRTHDPARRAFLPRREGAGQAPGALCSVVEGRGRRHRRFCAPPSPGPGRFRGWSAPAAFPRAAVLTGSQTSVQLLVTSSARSVRPPRANRCFISFQSPSGLPSVLSARPKPPPPGSAHDSSPGR